MELKLIVTAGPHTGKEFAFDGHDTFLVGRIGDAHLQLSYDDPYFSRRHFVVEINPPRCRVLDLGSRNGTFVNGARVATAELAHGDEIGAGHTRFKVAVFRQSPENQQTLDLPSPPANSDSTAAYLPGDQAIENSPDGRAGFSLDGYDVHELLGRGGMGEVYRATRRLDGADVAIKTITPAAGTTKRQVDRFLRECHILAQLSHPNVVGYFDARGEGGRVFLVTELVAGPDLGTIARQKSLAAKTAVRLICQMLGGLAHAHEKGFVHRDIKPANILLGGKSGGVRSAKLADFGLARAYQASKLSGLTMQGEIGGTPAFMAPEQVTHYRDVKPAADQYSAAASLYTLLTGYYPHDMDGNAAGQLVRISTQPSVPIADRGVRLPQGLSDVIHRALSQEPRCRFPDVLAFRKALIKFA